MLLYNVTVGVDKDIEAEWLQWMKGKHMQDVLNTGMFRHAKIYKILHDQEDGTVSYSVQYFTDDIQYVTHYLEHFAPALVEEHRQRFRDKHVVFQTLLEEA